MKYTLWFIFLLTIASGCRDTTGPYLCPPCDQSCDVLSFSEPGTCPHCKMTLVHKDSLTKEEDIVINEIKIEKGSGKFLIEGGKGNEDKTIEVYYHKPQNFSSNSKVLIVIPGAGRNADSYRDAWVSEAEEYSILILSPKYPEETYGFEDYHLGGVLSNLQLKGKLKYVEGSNQVILDEENLQYTHNKDAQNWIFSDFDRIFDVAITALETSQKEYDIFGHSAGGQILHRMVVFNSLTKAKQILASNSGFYTLPDFNTSLPFGLQGTSLTDDDLKEAFEKQLVLFIGELDNETETGGTLLRSKSADIQGLHRLARARFFYETSKKRAAELKTLFNWQLVVIPNTGHDHRQMGDAAANYLYNSTLPNSEKSEEK